MMRESTPKSALTLIFAVGVLTACGPYFSKFNFRRNLRVKPDATQILVIDSASVRGKIYTEEQRQAVKNRRISELPRPKPGDGPAARAWLEDAKKLIDFQARSAFLSDLKAMGTFDGSRSHSGNNREQERVQLHSL